MSTQLESETSRSRTTIYIIVAIVVAILMVVGLIAFNSATSNKEAEQKADQFIAALAAEGARTPTRDQVIHVLGDDGGATCNDPNAALNRGVLLSLLSNGATGPGMRPVIADSRVVRGQLLIIKIYCPDELPDFQEFVDDLKTSNVAG